MHSADWHLGRRLYQRRRDVEQKAFLQWLLHTIASENIHVLIVAGDVFDTTTPSVQAQELYFDFLAQLAQIPCCRHIIIVAGNHDSPIFLDAPAQILRYLNIHIIGQARLNPEEEVLNLRHHGKTELLVCAIPYLRERDVHQSKAGESFQDKNQKILAGTKAHYHAVFAHAQSLRGNNAIPIIGTGHLFCTAASSTEPETGEGVRELYVGTLNRFPATQFPPFDYLALGHLHIPQNVGSTTIRYSGSPIAIGFGEREHQKSITIIHFEKNIPHIKTLPIPIFQRLERIKGSFTYINSTIENFKQSTDSIWLEVIYTGSELMPDLNERLQALIENSNIELLNIKNLSRHSTTLNAQFPNETLTDLDVFDVFERCLHANQIQESEQANLRLLYHRAIQSINENN